MQSSSPTPYLFSKRIDIAMHVLPLAFLAAGVLFEVILGIQNKWTSPFDFLANVLFMSSLHAYLTVLGFAFLPSYKTWFQQQVSSKGIFHFVKIISISLGLALFLYGCLAFALAKGSLPLELAFLALVYILPVHHNIAQVRGLSFLYDSKIPKGSSHQTVQAIQKQERSLTFAMTLLYPSYFIVRAYAPVDLFAVLKWFWIIGMVAILGRILFLCWRSPSASGKIKFSLYLRLFNYVFAPFSFLAWAGYRSAHGTEYLACFSNQWKNEKLSRLRLLGLLAVGTIPFLFLSFVWYSKTSQMTNTDFSTALPIAGAIHGFFSYLHFALDRDLFSFRNPVSAEHILPLVKNEKLAS
jgi:hypothetical protein